MQLEVNKNHKRIDLKELKKPLKKFTVGALGAVLTMSIYSGAYPTIAYAQGTNSAIVEETVKDGEIVEIPETYSDYIHSAVGKDMEEKITTEDLKSIVNLYLSVTDNEQSLDFLKYCSNLETISIINNVDGVEYLQTIPEIPNLKSFDVSNLWYDAEINKEDLGFIEKCPNLKDVCIRGCVISPGCEDALNNSGTLQITAERNVDIDFTKLTGLKSLKVDSKNPYDLAMYLNSEEYQTLIDHGVEIIFDNDECKKKYLEISKKLDDIVSSLNVDQNSTDKEKLDAILIYVLENLQYDEEVAEALATNTEHRELTQSFYEGGMLYGALEKDTAICGNYTALVEALSDRLSSPADSYFMESNSHAWNLMNIDGQLYYVDATWLDDQGIMIESEEEVLSADGTTKTITINFERQPAEDAIKEGKANELQWYNESVDPEYIATIDQNGSHVPTNLPEYMFEDISSQQMEDSSIKEDATSSEQDDQEESKKEVKNVSQEKVKIKIGTKTIVVTLGALVGVLASIGGAVVVHNKKEEKKRRERMASSQNFYYNDSLNFGNPYPYNQNNSSNRRRRR